MRMEYPRRFTISSTFSRMRGLKKEKAEQSEVARAPSPIPLPLSPDDAPPEHRADVALLEGLKAEQALLQQKVLKISEEIRVRQGHRNANTSEYLHLVSHTDRAQAFRLKEAFERKNQYLSSVVSQLQRRLENYVSRQKQLERDTSLMRESDPSLLAMDGSHDRPQPDSSHLSEASYNPLGQSDSDLLAPHRLHQNPFPDIDRLPLPDDEYSVITSFSEDFQDLLGLGFNAKSSRANSLDRHAMGYLPMLEELAEIKETQINLELNFKSIAEQYNQHYAAFEESLHEEKYRLNQLQAQLNDLIDLHQNEVLNLKSELASLEEKIAYQSYESSRDIWEVLENFQSKLMRLEQQQQQGELLDHVNTRQLLGKSMNLLLIIFAVLLMLMSTISALILPFIKTRMRTLSTIIVFVLLFLSWHNWDSLTAFSARRLMFRWR
ncbi:transmembrane and coiled-coil domains protein 1-like [Scyliorhinus canicula]|uniref:transmembrane and coiled-coil domains protein 1-like n=1 Tax=Scyliorhinus canicula TaxID=7830 RepID=UPI0018F2DBD6|nr:transmembrane and coiled-coil domains protein 1-like [Scyliorhinus canicula]